jgi:ferredoxin--NADP+ reductase
MRILDKQILAETQETKIVKLVIYASEIALKAKPGQFVVLMVKEEGERIPLTIVETDPKIGSISLIFQKVGLTTKLLADLKIGESLFCLVGPLGNPTPIKKYGKIILVGGGVGIAELYPVAEALKKIGNQIITIIGVRTKALLILEKELKEISDELYVTTDDGSYQRKGLVTDVLLEVLKEDKFDLIYAVGPLLMMKRVFEVTKDFNIKTIVSLNALMVDATGMCGCCRVKVGGQIKFSCVDGPEFDAHLVDWDELIKRNSMYKEKERQAYINYEKSTYPA